MKKLKTQIGKRTSDWKKNVYEQDDQVYSNLILEEKS